MSEETDKPISTDVKRGEGGRFLPGTKGGPGGRRKLSDSELSMLGDAMPRAIQVLIDAMSATKSAAFEGVVMPSDEPDHDVRMKASDAIFTRLIGKPAQPVANEDGSPILGNVDAVMGALLKLAGGEQKSSE